MAAPALRAAGTWAGGTASVTPAIPVGTVANDILILIVECNALDGIAEPTDWDEVTGSPQVANTGDPTTGTKLQVFWKRATGSDVAPSFDAGDHTIAQIFGFSGCITTGNPWDVTAGDADTASTAAVVIPGATTTVADCLILAIVANGSDNTTTGGVSGWANADLSSVAELSDRWSNTGGGGGFGTATGVKATAGAYGATTATLSGVFGVTIQARLSIALKPPSSAVTGTIAVTQADQVAAFTGVIANPITGTIAVTQQDQIAAFVGTETISGTIAASQQDQVASFTGVVANPVTGTIAVTQDDQTANFTGTLGISGTIAVTQQDQTAAFTGLVANPVTGTIGVTQDDQTADFVGTVLAPITGTIAVVQADQTANFVGVVTDPAPTLFTGTGTSTILANSTSQIERNSTRRTLTRR